MPSEIVMLRQVIDLPLLIQSTQSHIVSLNHLFDLFAHRFLVRLVTAAFTLVRVDIVQVPTTVNFCQL